MREQPRLSTGTSNSTPTSSGGRCGIFELDPQPTFWPLVCRALIYLAINCAQPLLVDVMKYHGAASWSSLIYITPTYYGMLLAGVFDFPAILKQPRSNWKIALRLSAADLCHQLIEKAGLVLSGSAVYMVCSSTSIAWTALISTVLLNKKSSGIQWLGILLICWGLCQRVTVVNTTFGNSEWLGVMLVTSAAALHALSYVWNENALTGPEKIEGCTLVCMMGILSSVVLTAWTIFWTIPRWDSLFTSPIQQHGGSVTAAVLCWLCLLACAFVRSITLWYLLKHAGAVASGVLKGVRAAIVIVLSHFCFCSIDSHQCLSRSKGLSAVVCVTGVLVYSYGCTRPAKPKDTGFMAIEDESPRKAELFGERTAILTPPSGTLPQYTQSETCR